MSDSLDSGLARALARVGLPPPTDRERLSGGANMESWRFLAGGENLILRRAPSPEMMAGRPLDHHGEAQLIRAARASGVTAPDVVVELLPDDGIGSGFVMRALPGTPDPQAILASADPDLLIGDIARELAAVHRIDPAGLRLPALDARSGVAELTERFRLYGGDRPILALAARWLADNAPEDLPQRVVHGDFRLGNLLVDQGRLTGVLDWELAHLGDPLEDLAFGCMTVWRFSRPDRPGYGLTSLEGLASAYSAASGEPFDPVRFRFWTVYRTLWWALGCLQMGGYWRAGHDRSVERVVVARRTAEQELDLLLLLEGDAPEAERSRALPPGPTPAQPPQGEPTGPEMLTAVSEWLNDAVKPLLEGRERFNLAVARNALGIAAREMTARPDPHDAALAEDILAGRATLATPGLLSRLRRNALETLAADMPKYPALAAARAQWEGS